MCYLWILTLIVIGVSAIDVKSPLSCVVKVELKDRMINVVNKDELCSCLMYEKASPPRRMTSEPCHLSTLNSGGKLVISADSMCECAGYQTNITHKFTTKSDISYLTTASTAMGGIVSSKSHRAVTHLHTDTPTEDTVKDKKYLPATEVLNLTHTTDVTTEITKAKSDIFKNLTTGYTIITVTPVVSKLTNSSKVNESSITDKIEEPKPTTTERNKSTTLHLNSSVKVAMTETDIRTPVVIITDIDVNKTTNGTVKETVSLKDNIKNSTITTKSSESTTKELHPLDVKSYNASDTTILTKMRENTSTVSTYHSSDKSLLVSSTNETIKEIISLKDIVRNSTNTTESSKRSTTTKEVHPSDTKPYNASYVTNFTKLREKTSTVSKSYSTDKSLLVSSTNETIIKIVPLRDIIRNTTNTTESMESTSVTKEMHPLEVKPHDASHIIITTDTDLKEKTSTISMSHSTTDKSVLVSSQKAVDGLESRSTKNEKELTESTFSVIPIKTRASFYESDLGNKTVIPISTADKENVDTTNTGSSRTHTPKYKTNKVTVYTTTEIIRTNYNGTDHTTKIYNITTDEEKADVFTKDTSNTTPTTIQTTARNSSNAESGAIEGNVINSTNITLMAILTTICIVLLILFIVRMINSCFRKGSYVLPHVSDGNIEMESKK